MSIPILHFIIFISCMYSCEFYNLCRFRLIFPIVSENLCRSCDEFCYKDSSSLIVYKDECSIGDFMNLRSIPMTTVYNYLLYNIASSDLSDDCFTSLAVFGVMLAVHLGISFPFVDSSISHPPPIAIGKMYKNFGIFLCRLPCRFRLTKMSTCGIIWLLGARRNGVAARAPSHKKRTFQSSSSSLSM